MARKKYVMVVEWRDYITGTRAGIDHKVNYTCSASTVDEAIGKAKYVYGGPGKYGLVVSNIYSEDA